MSHSLHLIGQTVEEALRELEQSHSDMTGSRVQAEDLLEILLAVWLCLSLCFPRAYSALHLVLIAKSTYCSDGSSHVQSIRLLITRRDHLLRHDEFPRGWSTHRRSSGGLHSWSALAFVGWACIGGSGTVRERRVESRRVIQSSARWCGVAVRSCWLCCRLHSAPRRNHDQKSRDQSKRCWAFIEYMVSGSARREDRVVRLQVSKSWAVACWCTERENAANVPRDELGASYTSVACIVACILILIYPTWPI